jgi:surface carbohydrate biosynthesis protein
MHTTLGVPLSPPDRVPAPAAPRRVLISVPRKARDLEGHALIAYHLRTRHGCEVAFCTPTEVDARCLEFAPDVVVLEILHFHTRVRQARLAKRLGMKVVVHPIAGLYDDDHSRVAGHRTGATHEVDRYLVWGENARAALLAGGSIVEDQVRVVGAPRVDFYRPPLTALMGRRDDFLAALGFTNTRAPLIVWATSTPEFARVHESAVALRGGASEGASTSQIRAELEEQRRQFEEHSGIVLELARRHPEWNVIVKVHPREPVAPYSAVFGGAANVRIAGDTPVRPFLHHCDVLLQRGSTTATEGWLLGKPVLELGVQGYGGALPIDYLAGNHRVSGVDEAEATVACYLAGTPVSGEQRRAREAFVRRIYHKADGRAAERCAAEIAALLAPLHHTDADSARVRAAAAAAHAEASVREGARLPNRIKDVLGISRDTSLRGWNALRWLVGGRDRGRSAFERVASAEVERLYRTYDHGYRSSPDDALRAPGAA